MIAAALAVAASVPTASGSTLCTLGDPRIDEASGLGISRLHPGVLYVQNDSGDAARFFAVSAATGRTRAILTVPGAANVDWEDLAVARVGGRSSVYLGDIGDNDAVRPEITVYRVAEPAALRAGPTTRPDVWRLRYPTGPANAEALAVAPGGAAFIVTKSPAGRSEVYRLPARPDGERVQTLQPVAAFTAPGVGAYERSVTGASFSADGTVFAVRTYTDAHLWRVRGGDLAAAMRAAPERLALPPQPQGEGIAVDATRLLLDSEGHDSTVLAVPLPAAFRSTRDITGVRNENAPTTTAPGTSAPTSAPTDGTHGTDGRPAWRWPVAAAIAAGLVARIVLRLRRRRPGRRLR
jgi:hypothetical protein